MFLKKKFQELMSETYNLKNFLIEYLKPIKLPPLLENPLVSVLIANYNYGQYISEAIESVLNQTYQNFEIVICDDGSTDNSVEVIKSYAEKDARIRLITKENGGHASALNVAFQASKGDIVTILDADDYYMPERLQIIVEAFLEHPDCGLVCHPLKVINKHKKILKDIYGRNLMQGWLAPELLQGKTLVLPPASGLSIHRKVAEFCFPLPIHFRSWADRVLYERAAILTKVVAIPKVLAIYRQHGSNITGISNVLSLEKINYSIVKVEDILIDRKYFLERVCKTSVPAELMDIWKQRELVALKLAKSLWEKDISYKEHKKLLQNVDNRKVQFIWRILLSLPSPIARSIFKLWWGEWPGKRWLRRVIQINKW